MAIQKNIILENGITVGYWQLQDKMVNHKQKRAHCSFWGWVDRLARVNYPANPIVIFEYDWVGDYFPFSYISDETHDAYEKVKQSKVVTIDGVTSETNILVGATDC